MNRPAAVSHVNRGLFFLTLLWGIAIFWIAPRPPGIDFPQHVGQVALLRDLITGVSPWADIFRLNLWTPYLIGYGLALPLSFVMPAGASLQVVMSVAYVGFVLLGSRLRAHFQADARLDWLLFPAFFGFAYSWGFYTFLIASPVVLLFILVVERYALQRTPGHGVAVMLTGVLLLLSHGLAFVFAMVVAGILYTLRCHAAGGAWIKRWIVGVWPLVVPGIACIILYLISIRIQSEYWSHGMLSTGYDMSFNRIPRMFANTISDYYSPKIVFGIAMLGMLAAPWLLGLRPNRRSPLPWVMLGIVLLIQFFVPHTAMSTAYLYQRFALYFLLAYVLVFVPVPGVTTSPAATPARPRSGKLAMVVMVASVWLAMGYHSLELWRFSQEAKDFEPVLAVMEPQQRVLSLTMENNSEAADLAQPYRHFATWYQSEKQGLVDFNFAWFPPQIVRFKPDRLPSIRENIRGPGYTVKEFPLEPFRYVIVRHTKPLRANLFDGATCAPRKVMENGHWTLFDRRECGIVPG